MPRGHSPFCGRLSGEGGNQLRAPKASSGGPGHALRSVGAWQLIAWSGTESVSSALLYMELVVPPELHFEPIFDGRGGGKIGLATQAPAKVFEPITLETNTV